MLTAEDLASLHASIDALSRFLGGALPFLNTHNVEFFCLEEDHFWNSRADRLLRNREPVTISEVLNSLKTLANRISTSSSAGRQQRPNLSGIQEVNFENLDINDLVQQISDLSLNSLGFCSTAEDLVTLLQNQTNIDGASKQRSDTSVLAPAKAKFDRIMPEKKTHEVEEMTDLIHKIIVLLPSKTKNTMSVAEGLNYLVDMGSGKGYLGSYLNGLFNYNILGIEASLVNIDGSNKRSDRIEKIWPSLLRRANERAVAGGELERRGKRWRRRENRIMKQLAAEQQAGQEQHESSNKNAKESPTKGEIKFVSSWVSENMNLDSLLEAAFLADSANDANEDYNYGIIGLHTCGGLAIESLKLFLRHERAQFICIVPCCYHLLDEPDDILEVKKTVPPVTIPVSRILKAKEFHFGRTARMLSSYSPHRIGQTSKSNETVSTSNGNEDNMKEDISKFPLPDTLMYRSMFQRLVLIEKRNAVAIKVGRVRGNFSSFSEYVQAVEKANKLQYLEITPKDIHKVYEDVQHRIEPFQKFMLVKVMFAPLVEALILLDMLVFTLEQPAVKSACIVQLFDTATSPRCNAIFALKKSA